MHQQLLMLHDRRLARCNIHPVKQYHVPVSLAMHVSTVSRVLTWAKRTVHFSRGEEQNRENTRDREPTCLSCRAFCHIQGFSELGKAVIDGGLLQSSPISCQPLVQGDGVPLGVLPVGDAGWDLPVLLVLNADRARWGMHDGYWGRPCTSRNLQSATFA